MDMATLKAALDTAVRSPNHTFLGELAEPPLDWSEDAQPPFDVNAYIEVNVHFFTCWVVTEKIAEVEPGLREYVTGLDRELMIAGPSYIALGAEVGDQSLALRLMAFGEAAGWWKVVTPGLLGVPEPKASEMAGLGYVMITPPPPQFTPAAN